MGTINTKQTESRRQSKAKETAHLNFMGGTSYDITDPVHRLRVAAASCFMGEPMYYHTDGTPRKDTGNGRRYQGLSTGQIEHLAETLNSIEFKEWRTLSPAQLMESAIDAALDHDAEATLKLAVSLRSEDKIRVTPQVIMVRAANHKAVKGTRLIATYAEQIMQRMDEPATQLAYQLATFGKPVPNALKKAWAKKLAGASEYQLAKYRMDDRKVKTLDVVNLVHAKSEVIDKLMKGTLKLNETTWESIVSKHPGKDGWVQALPVLLRPGGHMALLRNLRNLYQNGLMTPDVTRALVEGAKTGKQLPFRYYSAYRQLQEHGVPGFVLDAVEASLMESLVNLPHFNGKVISLCDNSGSARGTTTSSMGTMKMATIANLSGILTGMVADEGELGIFGDALNTFSIRKGSSVFDQLDKAERLGEGIGGRTENGIWLFFRDAIQSKKHYDHIFVYSDMQAGHGGLYGVNAGDYRQYAWDGAHIDVAKLVDVYRRQVNPNVMVYLVQVAGYQDTLIPEFFDKTYILGGWGDGILRFAGAMQAMQPGQGIQVPQEGQIGQ